MLAFTCDTLKSLQITPDILLKELLLEETRESIPVITTGMLFVGSDIA
ncbi:MAG: hypothetical protein WC291_01160 [Thermodesulfovibrionales bacterium]